MRVPAPKKASDAIESTFSRLKNHLLTLRTEEISMRKNRLKKLRAWIHLNRQRIHEAMKLDLRKPAAEVDGTEIFHVLSEINLALNNLQRWTARKKIDAPVTMIGTRSFLQYEPKGLCLIIAPWNYPFSLCAGPLVSAIAAGNAVIIKPSELTRHVSAIVKEMVDAVFDDRVVAAIEGDVGVSQQLLALPFDHIFFTGSPSIGKIVMKAAAEHLSSVTLELGGKSPTIVTASANLNDAAQRIVAGKFINTGQTCVAPDYVLMEEAIAVPLVQKIIEQLKALFLEGNQSFKESKHYARVVNEKHFDRLLNLLQHALTEGASLTFSGGDHDRTELFFPPTIVTRADGKLPIGDDEIFGPILPIIAYRNLDEAIALINSKPKPLALYIFSSTLSERNKILRSTSSGAVCVNDCAIHFLHANLPFGGIGNSGMGRSHGHAGFLAFSNEKPVMKQRAGFTSVKAFYPPYTAFKEKLMSLFLKFF